MLYLGSIDHRMLGYSDKYLKLQSLSNFSLESKFASIARSLTKIGQASMNQDLMVVATKSCSLLFDIYPRILCEASLEDCCLQVSFEVFYWNLYEASLNGVTFQTCLKNPIPCIPSPKTSDYVRFSVGGQLWFLQTIKASVYS
ncbi:hypothetical protein IGI04_003014 [Brassica rapa subsp. trilocularis]|uniref:Uncharacterized protein n=1 Tax=Brassica rapa subsp. trilocularis TaxID=1813537 RepID=A0ABQ7NX69_BRACM|nr:hypothetical protein IGI04_003014 [Brassica rapa subsp. trilocularis]